MVATDTMYIRFNAAMFELVIYYASKLIASIVRGIRSMRQKFWYVKVAAKTIIINTSFSHTHNNNSCSNNT